MNNHPKEKPTIVFFGTPEFAVRSLEALDAAHLAPDVIVTAPDKPAGRGMELKSPPVKDWALERDIPVLQPTTLKPPSSVRYLDIAQKATAEALDVLTNSEWDLFIVVAYGKIIPKNILELPKRGTINVHASLLPRFRGASPIEGQILADEKVVGVTIMQIDEEMDHGPILSQASITPEGWPVKASYLEALLAKEGGELLTETVPAWLAGSIQAEPQNHAAATYVGKIEKADGEISLTDDPYQNYLKFCAYDGWPGVFFIHTKKGGETIRVKITDAVFENGAFMPVMVIPEGKKERSYEDFMRNTI